MKKNLFALLLAFLLLYFNLTIIPNVLRGLFANLVSPISMVFIESFNKYQDVTILFTKIENVRKENLLLKSKLQKTQEKYARIIEYINDNEEYKDALNTLSLSKNNFITGEIIGKKKVGNETFYILNKGTQSNVFEDTNIIDNGYLLGIVTIANTKDSLARVITSQKLDVPVESLENGTSGIYTCDETHCYVDKVITSEKLDIGDIFISSGITGKYKRGLLIGEVTQIDTRPQEAFKSAQIYSPINVDTVSKVGIILKNE